MSTLYRDGMRRSDSWYYSFMLANVASGGTSPLIPLFLVLAFSGSLFQVGLITAVTSIASIPAYIVWGNLSDHLRKRKLFVVEGFAGLAVSMAAMWLSVDFVMFLVANFLLGMIFTASAPSGTALVIERSPKERWAEELGRFSRIGSLGYLIGLTAGGLWFSFFPERAELMRSFFLFMTLTAFAATILAAMFIREGEVRHHRHWNSIADIPLRVTERAKYLPARVGALIRLSAPNGDERREVGGKLVAYYLITALFATGFTAFYAVLPNYLSYDVGRRFTFHTSYIFLVYIGSYIASTMTYGRVSAMAGRMGEWKLQSMAAAARIGIIPSFYLILPLLGNVQMAVTSMFALNALMGFCWAIISVTSQSLVAKMAGPHIKGEAMGFYNAAYGCGSIAGALIGGFAAQYYGYLSDFILSSAFVASGIAALIPLSNVAAGAEKRERKGMLPWIAKMLRTIFSF